MFSEFLLNSMRFWWNRIGGVIDISEPKAEYREWTDALQTRNTRQNYRIGYQSPILRVSSSIFSSFVSDLWFPLHGSNSDYFSGLFPPISSCLSLTRSLSGHHTKHTKNNIITTTMAAIISPRPPPPSNLWRHHRGGFLRRLVPTRWRLQAAIIPSRPLLWRVFSHGDGTPSPPHARESASIILFRMTGHLPTSPPRSKIVWINPRCPKKVNDVWCHCFCFSFCLKKMLRAAAATGFFGGFTAVWMNEPPNSFATASVCINN